MENKNVTLSVQLLNGLLEYLSTRPFREVAPLIMAIEKEVAPQKNNQSNLEN